MPEIQKWIKKLFDCLFEKMKVKYKNSKTTFHYHKA